jgi:hypothetical protein
VYPFFWNIYVSSAKVNALEFPLFWRIARVRVDVFRPKRFKSVLAVKLDRVEPLEFELVLELNEAIVKNLKEIKSL